MIRLLLIIWIPDLSGIQIPTVSDLLIIQFPAAIVVTLKDLSNPVHIPRLKEIMFEAWDLVLSRSGLLGAREGVIIDHDTIVIITLGRFY